MQTWLLVTHWTPEGVWGGKGFLVHILIAGHTPALGAIPAATPGSCILACAHAGACALCMAAGCGRQAAGGTGGGGRQAQAGAGHLHRLGCGCHAGCWPVLQPPRQRHKQQAAATPRPRRQRRRRMWLTQPAYFTWYARLRAVPAPRAVPCPVHQLLQHGRGWAAQAPISLLLLNRRWWASKCPPAASRGTQGSSQRQLCAV
jgi:hypothetical protein